MIYSKRQRSGNSGLDFLIQGIAPCYLKSYMVIRLTAVTPICCMVVLMLSLTDILSFYGSNTYSLIDKTVEQ